jgi:hypothetical protein
LPRETTEPNESLFHVLTRLEGQNMFEGPIKPLTWAELAGHPLPGLTCPSPARFPGADDGIRTRDPHLGKVMLYQLSHVRVGL